MSSPSVDQIRDFHSIISTLDSSGYSVSPAALEKIAQSSPAPLIAGLLPARALVTFAGQPGIGKSFVALDWAACVAMGRDWHGQKTGSPQYVAYIVGEGWSQFGKRVSAWSAQNQPLGEHLRFIDGSAQELDLCSPEKVDELIENLQVIKPALIIFDTFSALARVQSENDNSQVAAAYRQAQRIVSELGSTVVIVHHVSKEAGKVRGATAFRGNSDTVVTASVSKKGADQGFVISTRAAEDGKQRDGEAIRLTGFHIVKPGYVERDAAVAAQQSAGEQMKAFLERDAENRE